MVLRFDEGGGRTPEANEASDALRRRVEELEAENRKLKYALTLGGSKEQQASAWVLVYDALLDAGLRESPFWCNDNTGCEACVEYIRFLAGQSKECEQFRQVLHQGRRIPDRELMQDPAFLAFALARLEKANTGLREELLHVLSAEFKAEVEAARRYRGGCRFCGWQQEWETEQARQEGLNAHLDACEKSPIPRLRKRIDDLKCFVQLAREVARNTRITLESRHGIPGRSAPNCDLLDLEQKADSHLNAKE